MRMKGRLYVETSIRRSNLLQHIENSLLKFGRAVVFLALPDLIAKLRGNLVQQHGELVMCH